MKLKDILDDTALRGFLNWKYPFYPYHVQLQKYRRNEWVLSVEIVIENLRETVTYKDILILLINIFTFHKNQRVKIIKMIYCSCKKCNMKKPLRDEDPYDEAEDLEGIHTWMF